MAKKNNKPQITTTAKTGTFKDAQTTQEKFRKLATVMQGIEFRGADKKVMEEITELFSTANIEMRDDGLVLAISDDYAQEISTKLALPDENGEKQPIIAPAEVSDPDKLSDAVRRYVDATEAALTLQELMIASRDGQIEEITAQKVVQLKTLEGQLSTANQRAESAEKLARKHKVRSLVVSGVAVLLLAGTVLTGVSAYKYSQKAKTAEAAAAAANAELEEEKASGVAKDNQIRDLTSEIAEIKEVLEDHGFILSENTDLSETIDTILGQDATNEELQAVYATIVGIFEELGVNPEDLKDENGNFTLELVEPSLQGVANEAIENATVISEVVNKVDFALRQIERVEENGEVHIYSMEDFATVAEAIQFLSEYYNNLAAKNEELVAQNADLQQKLSDALQKYNEAIARIAELEEENAQLKQNNDQLTEENEQLKESNNQLTEENTQLKQENDQLKQENQDLTNGSQTNPTTPSTEGNGNTPVGDTSNPTDDDSNKNKDSENATGPKVDLEPGE